MRRVLALWGIVAVAAACSTTASKAAPVNTAGPGKAAGPSTTPAPDTNPASQGAPSWATIVTTLSDKLDVSSSNVCSSGAPSCLDAIINEMTRRFDAEAATCDHRAAFDLAYLDTTRGIRDAERSAPAPGVDEYLRHLDAVFARLDFNAADALSGPSSPDAAPRAWQIAFTAAATHQVTGMGDLLLGMNAHISRDLAFAVATAGLTLPDGTSAKAAFDTVNAVLATVQQPMLAEIARRFDPTVAAFDVSSISPAASTVGALLATWRDEAWVNAGRLTTATAAERPTVEASIEANADARAFAIMATTHYVPFVSTSAARDQYCAVHGRS